MYNDVQAGVAHLITIFLPGIFATVYQHLRAHLLTFSPMFLIQPGMLDFAADRGMQYLDFKMEKDRET